MRSWWPVLVVCLLAAWSSTPGSTQSSAAVDADSQSGVYAGSSAVPLDNWVYPAFDRLNALGYAPSAFEGMRPWTRLQCARLVQEAQGAIQSQGGDADEEAVHLVSLLAAEFSYEASVLDGERNTSVGVTSIYARATQITGPPLRDAYHFAQTIHDDFGRPYGEGLNFIAGTDLHADYGPFAFGVRGEYQNARALSDYSPTALIAIAAIDVLPVQPLPAVSAQSRLRPVEATVSLNLLGWQATFGQQNQWWGQGRTTSLILSNNAEAPVSLLIQRDKPWQLPGPLAYLGKMNNTFFLGQLRGHHFVRGPVPASILYGTPGKTVNPQPFIWGDQLDLKLTPNLEFGFEISCMWAGYGRPATLGTWLHTFSPHGNRQPVDPGKRYGGAHFGYRLPGLRSVKLYADALSNDEPTPINYLTRSAINSGIYVARLPLLRQVDARVEGGYTNIPDYADGIGSVYYNGHYAEGYRNAGQLIGSWMGRAGTAITGQTSYWFSGVNKVDFSVRRQWNDRHMIGGGDVTDFSAHTLWRLNRQWQLEGSVTAEHWHFQVLEPGTRNTVAATVGLTFTPPFKRLQ